jgi:FkbM family methyltransferase
MKNIIIKIAARITANHFAQVQLGKLALYANYLRGMGSGSHVASSGETAVFSFLPRNPVIFDVGANQGDFARAVSSAIPNAHLHCFEPSKKTFELLAKNVSGDSATLNNFGLGNQNASVALYSNGDGSGLASLSKRNLDDMGIHMDQKEIVDIRTLDGYCRDHEITKIDLLKVDVEGHEMDVFNGAIDYLKSRRVSLVMFEFGGCNIDSRTFFRDFYYFFRKLSVKSLARITPSGEFSPVSRYTEDLEYFRTTNYLVRF